MKNWVFEFIVLGHKFRKNVDTQVTQTVHRTNKPMLIISRANVLIGIGSWNGFVFSKTILSVQILHNL